MLPYHLVGGDISRCIIESAKELIKSEYYVTECCPGQRLTLMFKGISLSRHDVCFPTDAGKEVGQERIGGFARIGQWS